MASRSPLPLVVAALLGALAGAVAGALVAGRAAPTPSPQAAEAPRPVTRPGQAVDVESLELLLATLVDEVRGLRASLANTRQAAEPGEPGAAGDTGPTKATTEELTRALNALTRALQSGGGSAFGLGGRGLPVIDLPTRPSRFDLLEGRLAFEDEWERVRPFLLWNYQQVLDHFGSPTAVHQNGSWMYKEPDGSLEITLTFRDGLLNGIW